MKNLATKLAATLFILSGCAQNELVDSPSQGTPNDGRIRFAATSALTSTRAADGNPFNNTSNLQTLGEFTVDGYLNDVSIYNGTPQAVKWDGGSWEYTNEPYWPSGDAKINFFAYANWQNSADATIVISKDGISATEKTNGASITIGEDKLDGNGQRDLLVAATLGATKQTRTLISFKHALTQIVFKAGNVDKDKLDVRIGSVRIVNVKDKATSMTFNGSNLTWLLAGDADATYNVQGMEVNAAAGWSNATVGSNTYTVATTTKALGDYSDYAVIQKTGLEANAKKNNALLLLPQQFNAWDPNGTDLTKDSYIELLAVVKDPAKAAITTEDEIDTKKPFYYCGTPTWNTVDNKLVESYGIIRIPVSSLAGEIGEWIAGKRITYLITFGDKGSGSGGGGYTPGGDPVLVPIRFNAIVEDWVDVNVPLLTATFEANSGAVDGSFVDGYSKQLMNDIKAARAPKVYKSSIKISGQLSQQSTNQTITTTNLEDVNVLVGSTVTYDFSNINVWGKTLTIAVPNSNWSIVYMDKTGTVIESSKSPVLDGGSNENSAYKVTLTKDTEKANVYTCGSAEYLTDFFAAIRISEKSSTIRDAGWTINVSNNVAKDITFSADDLAVLSATTAGKTVVVNATIATGGKLSVTVPAGWKITSGSITKYAGEKLELSTAESVTITFTKL